MIPVDFTCTPDAATVGSEIRTQMVNTAVGNVNMQKETSFIRTVDMGGGIPAPGTSDIHSMLEKSVTITQYIYNSTSTITAAVRDFYHVNNTTTPARLKSRPPFPLAVQD